MRKLDRPSYRDQQAIRPVLSLQPDVDLIPPWKTPAICYLFPVPQHAPDQPPLFSHSFDPPTEKYGSGTLSGDRLNIDERERSSASQTNQLSDPQLRRLGSRPA